MSSRRQTTQQLSLYVSVKSFWDESALFFLPQLPDPYDLMTILIQIFAWVQSCAKQLSLAAFVHVTLAKGFANQSVELLKLYRVWLCMSRGLKQSVMGCLYIVIKI